MKWFIHSAVIAALVLFVEGGASAGGTSSGSANGSPATPGVYYVGALVQCGAHASAYASVSAGRADSYSFALWAKTWASDGIGGAPPTDNHTLNADGSGGINFSGLGFTSLSQDWTYTTLEGVGPHTSTVGYGGKAEGFFNGVPFTGNYSIVWTTVASEYQVLPPQPPGDGGGPLPVVVGEGETS